MRPKYGGMRVVCMDGDGLRDMPPLDSRAGDLILSSFPVAIFIMVILYVIITIIHHRDHLDVKV